MKIKALSIILFLTVQIGLSQKVPIKNGDVKIELIGKSFKRDKYGDLKKQKTNKKNRPYSIFYFDKKGILLERINFGKQHNSDLRLIDEVKIYRYDSIGRLEKVDEWQTDYEKNISYTYYKNYTYSNLDNLINTKLYFADSDSLFIETEYWYDEESKYQGVRYDDSYYYQRSYDEYDRLISLQQIYDSNLRWEWKYEYIDRKRIGIFKTYYKDGKDYTKKEICQYDRSEQLIEREEFYIDRDGLKEKEKYLYNESGFIRMIEYFRDYGIDNKYRKEGYVKIKSKGVKNLNKEVIDKLNKEILEK